MATEFNNNDDFIVEDEAVETEAMLAEDTDLFDDYTDEDFDDIEAGGSTAATLLKIQDVMDVVSYVNDARGKKANGDIELKSLIRKTLAFDRRQARYVSALSKGSDWANWNRLQLITLTGQRPKKVVNGRVVTLKKMTAIITEVQAETGAVMNRYLVNVTPKTFRRYARDLDVLVGYLKESRPHFDISAADLTLSDGKIRELVTSGSLATRSLED